jgi:hypothetical protein
MNLVSQEHGIIDPLIEKKMQMDLQGSKIIILLLISWKSSNYQAKLFFFKCTIVVVVEQDDRLIGFALENICFFDELQFFWGNFINQAFEEWFYVLLLIAEHQYIIFSFVIDMAEFR